ncbi:mcrBC 5-methylcytosine restriction system component family protein [Marinobacterium nitratireducens]|uniref:McrBC 5-methylcytosine restriction system component family protein n=1 Tax=Marinobacterium nitratireducens TaxID=518897 RepID=A0A917Z822_9GAMM|nr:McrC family protein [Marinobacterium nitratireducens]GGO77659.1 mcrBC 5-methylcytosine restriction system component family protein [Marinobacterium nitratireducens]
MHCITCFEFDALVGSESGVQEGANLHSVPAQVFDWLESQALYLSDRVESDTRSWLRLTQRRGRRAVQLTGFVGVIRVPDGFQIEVLPKVGKAIGGGVEDARTLLIDMLRCLGGFRHIQTDSAKLKATHMPLLEVFIAEFLQSVDHVVKRGLHGGYHVREENLFALRGKLHVAQHLRQNLCRRDRFFAEYDEFSTNRPENRLLHSALRCALLASTSQANQQLARELCFVFADVPVSDVPAHDFQRVRLDRGMMHYDNALAWARLILASASPLTGAGDHHAPSLLFPMESVFEAFVAKHLARQLAPSFILKAQTRALSLVRHRGRDWFRLKPDLLVTEGGRNRLVLDTKWKLIDGRKDNGSEKYGLSQGDFYQLYAYGQGYLDGVGDVVLIYPKTDVLHEALPVFEFPKSKDLRLWVLPFCLRSRRLSVPEGAPFVGVFLASRLLQATGSEFTAAE